MCSLILTRRSLLRKARYEYVMTSSNDARGIDVALLYSPFSFRLIKADTLRVKPMKNMRPTRDILHVEGEIETVIRYTSSYFMHRVEWVANFIPDLLENT